MDIDNISKNSGISKSLIEQNKFLSNKEKEKILSIFSSVDEIEDDGIQGEITLAEGIGNFLKETKQYLGEKYDKFLDNTGLSYFKNDKNRDGVVSEGDFSEDVIDKLYDNDLFIIFHGQKWTPEIEKIISSVLKNSPLKEKFIKVRIPNELSTNKNIIYDVKNKTLKIAEDTDKSYGIFTKYQYDKNGLLKSKQTVNTIEDDYHAYSIDDKKYALSDWSISWLAEQEGFPSLSEKELPEEKKQLYKDIFDGKYGNVWRKSEYKYDKKGELTEQKDYIRDEISTSTWQNDIEEEIVRKTNGEFVSHEKRFLRIEENDSTTKVIENYDDQGSFMYKTTEIETRYNPPKVIKDKNGKDIKIDSDTRIIKEYADGRVEEEYSYDENYSEESTERKECEDMSFVRKDGIRCDINTRDASSLITITKPDGNSFSINITESSKDGDYLQKQLPQIKNLFDSLPEKVLEDLSNEISNIRLERYSNFSYDDAYYMYNTNVMTICNTKQLITFIHEIGHAIDDNKGIHLSQSPEYVAKFSRLQELANKLNINDENHALDLPEEFFASVYANQELKGGKTDYNKINPNGLKYSPDHIEVLNYRVRNFKNSDNPEERECYEIYQSLKADTITSIENVRKQTKDERCNTAVMELVRNELKDIIKGLNKHYYEIAGILDVDGLGIDLSLLNVLDDDEVFNEFIDVCEQYSEQKGITNSHYKLSDEVKKLLAELVTKLPKIREKIKQN